MGRMHVVVSSQRRALRKDIISRSSLAMSLMAGT
jgi:hypothetical protein